VNERTPAALLDGLAQYALSAQAAAAPAARLTAAHCSVGAALETRPAPAARCNAFLNMMGRSRNNLNVSAQSACCSTVAWQRTRNVRRRHRTSSRHGGVRQAATAHHSVGRMAACTHETGMEQSAAEHPLTLQRLTTNAIHAISQSQVVQHGHIHTN
jgi:hypothetical protein